MTTVKPIGKINAKALAEFILMKFGPMSHLKLQKLLYYCEAYHLAYFDESLIPEEFQAWMHGPVCIEIYHELKGESVLYGDVKFDGQTDPEKAISEALSSVQTELLHDVLSELSTWTAFQLENATHREEPWIKARTGFGPGERCENIISKDLMKSFYKKEISGELER